MGASDVAGMIWITQDEMAKKRNWVFFIYPRWNEIADTARIGARGVSTPIRVTTRRAHLTDARLYTL
jgi:hypothetical protein